MRLDKYLKVSRLIKRRTVASSACTGGKIIVNNKAEKPSYKVKIDDIIEIQMGANPIKVIVTELNEHAKKDDAHLMYKAV